jgi:4-hydroxybenzoate polyprenyltransferase
MQAISWQQRLWAYVQLTRFDRPVGIELLLWPTLWAVWLAADGQPAWDIVLIFTLGAVLMRAAGCAINDLLIAMLMGQVERTKHRPLASGRISAKKRCVVFAVLVASECQFAAIFAHRSVVVVVWCIGACHALSVYEAVYLLAAVCVGGCVFVGNSDGICGARSCH